MISRLDNGVAVHDFAARKAQLAGLIGRLAGIARDRGGGLDQELTNLQEKLAANRFYLAVLGQFKRGKTTLINALLGDEVLPAGVVPLTSILTVLTYAERLWATVHFLSGERRRIGMGEIGDYVTELANPENRKAVRQVEVGYPSPWLQQDILLVDTPGIGSTLQHNTEMTHSFLAKVDAAVFLVSVDPPLTQPEAEFLARAAAEVHHFFWVLNKTDLMSDAEMRESLGFTTEQIRKITGLNGAAMFPVSARRALEAKRAGHSPLLEASGLPALERALQAFLVEDRGEVLLAAAIADVLRIAGELRFAIELERKALATPVAELTDKRARLAAELGRVEQERLDMNLLLRAGAARLMTRVEDHLRQAVEQAVPQALTRLEQLHGSQSNGGRRELLRRLDEFTRSEVETFFNSWRIAEDRRLNQAFREMAARFAQRASGIVHEIRRLAASLFAVEVETFDNAPGLALTGGLDYKVDALFYFAIDKAPFALPGPLFRRHVMRKMRDHVRMEFERNSGRVRYDYLRRIEKATAEFQQELNAGIEAVLAAIEKALARAAEAGAAAGAEARTRGQALDDQARQLDELLSMMPQEARPA